MENKKKLRKVISFSLYGNNPLYTLGAIENAKLGNLIFKDWEIYFYIHINVSEDIIKVLEKYNCKIIIIDKFYHDERELIAKCTFWRYYVLNEKNIDYIIFRDCDTRLSYKELSCINLWIKSNKKFNFIYDHIDHKKFILGGLWGIKGNVITNFKKLMNNFFLRHDPQLRFNRSYDEIFLNTIIYPTFVNNNNYIAFGNKNNCEFHISKNIKINSFPSKHKGFVQTGINKQYFIGQTILCPYWQKKPISYNLKN